MGDACLGIGDLSQAESYYGQALKLGFDKYAYLGLTRLMCKRNRIGDAFRLLAAAAERAPNDSRIQAEMNRLKERIGRMAAE
jgi:Flp pilus assembly protein TadD